MPESAGEPWTVLRLLNWTKQYFERAGMDDARLAAEVLLAHVLNCRRIELYARFDAQPTADQRQQYKLLVQRAAGHEPVAYLTGEKEFYSLRFKVTPEVLIPRPETELLVGEAVDHLRRLNGPARAWDVCTGSGCVAVAVAVNAPQAEVLATDISPGATAVAERNAAAQGVQARLRVRAGDLLAVPADCPQWQQCDVVTANPPYVADADEVAPSVRHEPVLALRAGPDGLAIIRHLVEQAPGVLRAGGLLAMEFGSGQADAVRDLLVAGGAFGEPRILRDHQGIERAAAAIRK